MRILELNQRILAMDRSIQDENVKSAISGEVIEAFVSQQGEFVGQGQVIARVIPADSPFIVEAEVDPVFLGRIEIGMSAKITPASFDPINDGHMTGIVQKIAKNSTTSNNGSVFYKVTIKLEEYSGDFTLTAGMVSEVSFVDKRTTVAEYLKSAIFVILRECCGDRIIIIIDVVIADVETIDVISTSVANCCVQGTIIIKIVRREDI